MPAARDTLAQKVLEAPRERVMGARKAVGVRRRMEGIVVAFVSFGIGGLSESEVEKVCVVDGKCRSVVKMCV